MLCIIQHSLIKHDPYPYLCLAFSACLNVAEIYWRIIRVLPQPCQVSAMAATGSLIHWIMPTTSRHLPLHCKSLSIKWLHSFFRWHSWMTVVMLSLWVVLGCRWTDGGKRSQPAILSDVRSQTLNLGISVVWLSSKLTWCNIHFTSRMNE